MGGYAHLQIVVGIFLALSFTWPIIKASKEGPRYLLPTRPEPAMLAACFCTLLAWVAIPTAFLSSGLSGWIALIAVIGSLIFADGPLWRFFLKTDFLPFFLLTGAIGSVLLILAFVAMM